MTEYIDPLVLHLQKLSAEDSNRPPDRAALAALRTSLMKDDPLDALRVILPGLHIAKTTSEPERRRREDAAVLLAQLYALHPVTASVSLGAALRRVARERDSDSVELRFRALLAASSEELPSHLRHAVTLIGASGGGIDWADLHRAIQRWSLPDNHAKRAWARDYWVYEGPDTDESQKTDAPQPPSPTT